MIKRILVVACIAALVVALGATAAFAEGYNSDKGTGIADNGGVGDYTRASGYFSGPHGGYNTTTNKCQDCHSTHYAYGSYKLLRANEAAAACDYCHGGGGGSTVNIMMDNNYRAGKFNPYFSGGMPGNEASMAPSAKSDDTVALAGGKGTGHTLGFKGKAPVDIKPAWSDTVDGMACFSCHSPHGNSARILTTFADPGRHFAAPGQDGRPLTSQLNSATANWPIKAGFGSGDKDALLENNEWGVDYEYGNFVWDHDPSANFLFRYRPIWPTGRFLLLKNPHSDANEGQADTVVATSTVATNGLNKFKIDWAEPLGPADTSYGGFQDNDNDNNFPFAPKETSDTDGFGYDGNGQLDGGFLSISEFCTDCHDGAAGASTQKAVVWNSTEETYTVAYSHDAQPRH